MFIWKLDTSNLADAPKIFSDEGTEEVENKENWTVIKQIRYIQNFVVFIQKDLAADFELTPIMFVQSVSCHQHSYALNETLA